MAKPLSVRLQPQCVDALDKIAQKRLEDGVRDSKARLVAEAVALLSNKEFAHAGND